MKEKKNKRHNRCNTAPKKYDPCAKARTKRRAFAQMLDGVKLVKGIF